MTREESREELLKEKLDYLGQLTFEWEEKQRTFEYEHRDELAKIAMLKEELKDELIQSGSSLECEKMKAQYRKGTVRWDGKALDGYAEAHPEIKKWRKVGKPTVAFILKDVEPFDNE